MNGADEQDLRTQLDSALMTITPRPAPIDAVIRQGKRTVTRRRVSVASGLAAVAIAAVTVPALVNQHTAGPALTRPAAVTVTRPGPGSPAGLIASGTVGAGHWSARVTGKDCVIVTGAATECANGPHPGSLVDFYGTGGSGYVTEFGPVKSAVTRVTVALADGQRLVLHPVSAAGGRWVAFPVPAGTQVRRATAYAGARELGYAIPFNGPTGTSNLPTITTWLAPGAAGPARVTARLGSGFVEYAGPWGHCFTAASPLPTTFCDPGTGSELGNSQSLSVLVRPPSRNGPGAYLVIVAPPVSGVRVELTGGHSLTPPIVRGADAERFITFTVGPGQQVQHIQPSTEPAHYRPVN